MGLFVIIYPTPELNLENNMRKVIPLFILLYISCEDSIKTTEDSDILFISSEGTFGNSDGSIAVIKNNQVIQSVENIGDVVQSLLVDGDKLFVIANNSHLIKKYTITESGLNLPGIEISTNNSSPRNMVIVNDKLYFTNWNSMDVKILNLNTYAIETSIPLQGIPEDIVYDGQYLWISLPNLELYDTNQGSSVVKIDISSNSILQTYEVGRGPQQLIIDNNFLWISRTFYSSDWYTAYYGSSKLDLETGEVTINNYGPGIVCGGGILKINEIVYRTTRGGIAPLDDDLSLNLSAKIGSLSTRTPYSAFHDNDDILYLGTSDYNAPDTVFTYNEIGELETFISVGALPNDYAIWKNN